MAGQIIDVLFEQCATRIDALPIVRRLRLATLPIAYESDEQNIAKRTIAQMEADSNRTKHKQKQIWQSYRQSLVGAAQLLAQRFALRGACAADVADR